LNVCESFAVENVSSPKSKLPRVCIIGFLGLYVAVKGLGFLRIPPSLNVLMLLALDVE